MATKKLLPLFALLLVLCGLAASLPFFWDGCFFSETAVRFHEQGWGNWIPRQDLDTGGFPLFSVYLTLCWKIFGKSLLVSHLALFPFAALLLYAYAGICEKFLSVKMKWMALLLFFIDPSLITQLLLMGYDVMMAAFLLFGILAILKKKKWWLMIAFFFLALTHVRGMLAAGMLITMYVYWEKDKKATNLLLFLPGIAVAGCWLIYHHEITGWWLFSPARESTAERSSTLTEIFHQTIFMVWKWIDLGRFLTWGIAIIGMIFHRRYFNGARTSVLPFLLILCLGSMLSMVPFSNPIGHKYFLAIFLLLNIMALSVLEKIQGKTMRTGLLVGMALLLLSGNFWMMPERFGNAWDASLKAIPYFGAQQEMDRFIQEQRLSCDSIGTQFPLIADQRFSYLKEEKSAYPNVWSGPLERFPFFLYSNVINTDIPEQFEAARKNWILLKEIRRGQVVLALYRRPSHQ